MTRSRDVKSQSEQRPQAASHPSESEQPQLSRGLTPPNSRLHPETENSRPSSRSLSLNYGAGTQFNAPEGTLNTNTGSGNQFPGATFNGYVEFRLDSNQNDRSRKEKEIELLGCLNASPFRDRKDRNPNCVQGTCDWFVSHELFRAWQESTTSTILWVSADPGCGKSVLAKYLVDSVLPITKSRTVCYFFFKDDFEDQRSVVSALCCILRQLFTQKPILLSDTILRQFEVDGQQFTSSFTELWQALINATEDENAGEIVCLLDAIDECEDRGWSQLTRELCKLRSTRKNFNLKFLLTSRPYTRIRQAFQPLDIPGLPVIHLSGESDKEMAKISREIDIFIKARVQDIRARLRLTYDEQELLLQKLMCVPNRTYLWVHLTLDLIEKDINIDIDKTRISKATSHLPKTVDEAYDKILSKSRNLEKAKKILHIIVAAARPLTLKEMSLALMLRENHQSYSDLNFEPEDRFHEKVREICGLFVTIIGSKIYLLHQTAREFLVQNDTVNSPEGARQKLTWKYSLRPQESHRILAEICIRHLLFAEFETHPHDRKKPLSQCVEDHIFLDYSANHWAVHLRVLPIEIQDAMIESILRICDTSSKRFQTWFRIYWTSTNTDFPKRFTTLMVASYFGLEIIVECLLKRDGIDLESRDDTHQRSALSWAAGNGFHVVVKALIKHPAINLRNLKRLFEKGAEVNSVDKYGRMPLSYAVWSGNVAVVKLLIKAGAKVDSKDEIGGTPLSYAVCSGHKEVIELLLKKGTEVGSEDDIIKELLFSAVQKGHEAVVRLLLETGKADVNWEDKYGRTALLWAAERGDEAVVRLLLNTGNVDVNWKDEYGRTPLSRAAGRGDEAVVRLLLNTGNVDINWKDRYGRTALSWAVERGHEAVVRLLLETGKAGVNRKDINGWTPLSWAVERGDEAVVRLLLETGKADVHWKDINGWTALSRAAERGDEAVVRLLLETGKANVNWKDENGWTALSWAVERGHEAVVRLLLGDWQGRRQPEG